jgi:uncharacterized protein DUF4255/IPT/TIG domain-containing protein
MSNSLAIAAVTATLRNLLIAGVTVMPDLADATVTTQLPDRARSTTNTANQINLFLYQAVPNAAWRNLDMPRHMRPGETAAPPLALNLYYLLTAYGRDNDAVRPFSHELLGRAMSVLHDHPLLGADEIRTALSGNDLFQQIERIRFSLQPLSVDEIYRLWTGFQTPYRTSVAYEASVVLIDSTRDVAAPLPVLMRGPKDVGVLLQPGIGSPAIESIDPGFDVTFGDTLTISGAQLAGDTVLVSFATPRLAAPLVVQPVPGKSSATQVTVQVPQDPALPAGWYTVSVAVTRGTFKQTSNELAIALGPQVTTGLPNKLQAVNGAVQVTLGCAPPIVDGQRVALLLDGREIAPVAAPRPANSVTFDVTGVSAGTTFVVRLRVDGADSPVLDRTVDRTKAPPAFDPKRTIAIT